MCFLSILPREQVWASKDHMFARPSSGAGEIPTQEGAYLSLDIAISLDTKHTVFLHSLTATRKCGSESACIAH